MLPHHPPTPSSEEEGEHDKAPSSSEEGVGGGGGRTRLLAYARHMRSNPTQPELQLWQALRSSQLAEHKFRRQTVIGNRIVDFFCPSKGLVMEVDGATHDWERDRRRDASLSEQTGFTVLRFTNEQVMRERESVLQSIVDALAQCPGRWQHHPPTPSSEEEGE